MSTISTIIFDLGGVLIDWNPRRLYRKLLPDEAAVDAFLSDICTQAWNEEQDAGRSLDEATRVLSGQFPEHRELIGAYYSRWEEMLGGQIEGTVDLLEELAAAKSHQLLALTNFSNETFPVAVARYPFLSHFEDILVSGDVKLKKPDPAIFHLLLNRHQLVPGNAVFIDDALHNVKAAAGLGLHAIHFVSPEQVRQDLTDIL